MSLRMILIVSVGLIALYGLFTVGSPFLLAIICAIFLERLVRLFTDRLKWTRFWAATLVCSLFTAGFIGLFYVIGLNAFNQLVSFGKNLPSYFEQFNANYKDPDWRAQFLYDAFPADVADQINAGIESIITNISTVINSFVSGLSGFFLSLASAIPNALIFFLVFFIALFLVSYQFPLMKNGFLGMFHESSRSKLETVLHNLREAIFGFLRAQIILSSLTYVIVLTGLLIIGVDYPLAIALLIVIVDILPVLGTGSVLVPWAVYCFMTADPRTAVGLLILFIFITIFRRVIEPKILSDAIGINTLAALASLYIGFKLFGGIGLLFGPAVVIIFTAMRKAGLLNINIKVD